MFVMAFILGVAFATAGLLGKHINASLGMGWQLSRPKLHAYVTSLGSLSNLVLPIISIVMAMAVTGLANGLIVAVLMFAGAFSAGMLPIGFYGRTIVALLGLPVAILAFVASLFN